MAKMVSARQKSILLLCLLLIISIGGCQAAKSDNLSDNSIPVELAKIQSNIESGDIGNSAKKAERWIEKNPDSEHMELAIKLHADALFCMEKYYKAYLEYENLLNNFGATKNFKYVISQEIEIAKLFIAGKTRKFLGVFNVSARLEGLKILDDIDSRWPGSTAAAEAVMLRADHFFDAEKYFEAELEYHRITVSYSKSCHYRRAVYLVAESKFRQYEGIYYDTNCLDEAKVLFEQLKLRFPAYASSLGIDDKIEWILAEKLKKEYEIADFYYRTGKTQQAILYWNSLIEMAPASEYAQQAIERIQIARELEN